MDQNKRTHILARGLHLFVIAALLAAVGPDGAPVADNRVILRSPGKSLKTLSAPVLGGVAGEVTLQKPPRGRGSEHFPGKLILDEEVRI